MNRETTTTVSKTAVPDAFEHIRAVMDVLPVGVLLVEAGSTPTAATAARFNAVYARIVGCDPPHGVDATKLPYVYYRPDRSTRVPVSEWPAVQAIQAIQTGNVVTDQELRLVRPDGEWRVVLASAAPVRAGGAVKGAVVIIRDITVRSDLERALEKAKVEAERHAADLRLVLDAVPAAVFITHDRMAATMEANRACAEMLRVAPGTNVSKTAPPDEAPQQFRAMRNGVEIRPEDLPVQVAAATGVEVRDYEFDLVFENETVRHWFGNAAPILNDDGSPGGAVGAFVDITDRKRAESALREADQEKTKFMAVLSHELRNPVGPISSSASTCAPVARAARAPAVSTRLTTSRRARTRSRAR